jgi:hypothetical protein
MRRPALTLKDGSRAIVSSWCSWKSFESWHDRTAGNRGRAGVRVGRSSRRVRASPDQPTPSRPALDAIPGHSHSLRGTPASSNVPVRLGAVHPCGACDLEHCGLLCGRASLPGNFASGRPDRQRWCQRHRFPGSRVVQERRASQWNLLRPRDDGGDVCVPGRSLRISGRRAHH